MIALCCYRGAISKRWTSAPKVILWLYDAIINVLCGLCIVKDARKDYAAKKLESVQCTGNAQISTPTVTLNAILNEYIAPINIIGKCMTAKVAIRLSF